jgi:hypothetical protein
MAYETAKPEEWPMNGLRTSETGRIANDEFSVSSSAAVKWKNAHVRNKNKFTLKII